MSKPTESKYRMIKMRADKLKIHPVVQRRQVASRIKHIVENCDFDALGIIHLTNYPREGIKELLVIDGQNRIAAIMQLGLGEWEVSCRVHDDITNDADAWLRALQINDASPWGPYDKFMGMVGAPIGSFAAAKGAYEICAKHGLEISNHQKVGTIICVRTLRKRLGQCVAQEIINIYNRLRRSRKLAAL